MSGKHPIEYTGKVLDQRKDLTGSDEGKGAYPERPQHVTIQQQSRNKGK
ncbi:hypothetical protein QFZ87_002622 [Bacillus sp. SLBN-46]|nr:hypothetical protein [Bacillus sp. SLBN-46]MDR6123025.1 hypothetical protein [Bacillus sp. SLBN-46]